MMRRFPDAIKAFSHILLFISRTKQYHTRSYQFEVINKKADQMYALLSVCVAVCPTRLDENIHAVLREKHGEHVLKMQRGYVSTLSFL
jgi:translation initiation factor 3 subunit L